ncbi:hypothetical protein QR680_014900 [Steinernema hermaphroditum]|uniref:BBSome complex member BBS5 n=1 Tax=Steinernema hermaphroditum TaxID=289476 RepID=A0AA39IAF5_9BILA|nr:hypothetical protein QR680_014900 [Steinernema hermaphroditum]
MATEVENVWQDREVRFDLEPRQLKLSPGEVLVEEIDSVEDTKGSNGDHGTLKVTNLRLIWYATSMPQTNLSIGYMTISNATVDTHGSTESLNLITKNFNSKFEFIFTGTNTGESMLFAAVLKMHKAYEESKMFRDLKMRGSFMTEDGQLELLPGEQLVERVEEVWNLSSDTDNVGVMLLTNIRVVWFSTNNNKFNVSIPYLQLAKCWIRDAKLSQTLVIETSVLSGEYVLGYRIDSDTRLQEVCKSIQSLQETYIKKPNFGVPEAETREQQTPGEAEAEEPEFL